MYQSEQENVAARRVTAVIVHHGDPRRTVRAVLNHCKLGVFANVIVVANDRCQRPDDLKDVKCIWLVPPRNIGFGGACQLGAMSCRSDVYAFFNAHVTMDSASVECCRAAFDIDNVGIASPYIYHPRSGKPVVDWKYTHCIRTYSRILRLPIQVPLKKGHIKDHASHPVDLLDNDWASGGAIFCRHEVIKDIGWDGSYFLGLEDVDISMRAKRSGWRVVTVPSAIAFHTGESTRTSTIAAYYSPRNNLWFARRYYGRGIQALLTTYFLVCLFRVAAADVLKRRWPPHARAATRGILDGWLLWPDGMDALLTEPMWLNGD